MSCPSCFQGTLHTGTPRGTETLLHGLKTYVTAPSNDDVDVDLKGVVVIAPDALGWTFCNTRLLADRMAEEGGWTVYVPDLMDGERCFFFFSLSFLLLFAQKLWGKWM